jgi:hypothetical protein
VLHFSIRENKFEGQSFSEKVISAAPCAFCGNAYFTTERAQIRSAAEPQANFFFSAALCVSRRLCGNAYFTAERAEIRREERREENFVAALLHCDSLE